MKIYKVKIKNWRNLRDVTAAFDTEKLTTALLGVNGTGKSNLMEAIVNIFRNIDLGEPPPFQYEILYECRGRNIKIAGEPDKTAAKGYINIAVDNQDQAWKAFWESKDKYLPNHIFAYYSGSQDRLSPLFDQHLNKFYQSTLSGSKEAMRRLFNCMLAHSNYVLLAWYCSNDDEARTWLDNRMHITGIESALIELSTPFWFKGRPSKIMLEEGDPRFWYARGVVSDFLSQLWDLALAPIRHKSQRSIDFRGRREQKGFLYLFIKDEEQLKKLASMYLDEKRFFTELETTYVNDLIEETRIKVKRRGVKQGITFQTLSEGERQLLTVLGLMRFTRDNECLFLLDEPDTHLNPTWTYKYIEDVQNTLKGDASCQVIIATHDPLMVNNLSKEAVLVFEKMDQPGTEQGAMAGVRCYQPENDPKIMGISGLLRSEMFGLQTTLHPEMIEKLDRRAELLSKGDKMTLKEKAEMIQLSDELGRSGFGHEFRDPLYHRYVKLITERKTKTRAVMTPTEIREEEEYAAKVIERILDEEMENDAH